MTARPFLAVLAVLLLTPLGPPAAGAQGEDPRKARADLLLRIAELTDRRAGAEAGVVLSQFRQVEADSALVRARARLRARAVEAYVHGNSLSPEARRGPLLYLEIAVQKERQVVARARSARTAADAARDTAEEARADLRAAEVELALVRARLDREVAVVEAREAEERRADEARRRAIAERERAEAEARARSRLPGAGPIDPGALQPRHRRATERQLLLMARYPFGPLPPGPLPAGLVATGQRIEGLASWYGPGFHGRATASGAIYDQEGWTVASRTLPLGTLLVVARGDKRVLLLVNDRGPYVEPRVLDLSAAAARYLGVGVTPVVADVVVPT